MHKQQGWPQAWEYSQAKLIQTLVRASQGVDWSWSQCTKSHHAQTSSGKGLPSHFWTRDNVRSVLPGLWRKITGLLLSGPQSRSSLYAEYARYIGPPKHQGTPCSQRCFNFSLVFNFGQRFWKQEWSFLLMWCAVTLSTYKSAKSCNVNVVQSLALT